MYRLITGLCDCGLVHKTSRVNTTKLPPKARKKFTPALSVRTFMADFKKEDWLINLPLYIEQLAGMEND